MSPIFYCWFFLVGCLLLGQLITFGFFVNGFSVWRNILANKSEKGKSNKVFNCFFRTLCKSFPHFYRHCCCCFSFFYSFLFFLSFPHRKFLTGADFKCNSVPRPKLKNAKNFSPLAADFFHFHSVLFCFAAATFVLFSRQFKNALPNVSPKSYCSAYCCCCFCSCCCTFPAFPRWPHGFSFIFWMYCYFKRVHLEKLKYLF